MCFSFYNAGMYISIMLPERVGRGREREKERERERKKESSFWESCSVKHVKGTTYCLQCLNCQLYTKSIIKSIFCQ